MFGNGTSSIYLSTLCAFLRFYHMLCIFGFFSSHLDLFFLFCEPYTLLLLLLLLTIALISLHFIRSLQCLKWTTFHLLVIFFVRASSGEWLVIFRAAHKIILYEKNGKKTRKTCTPIVYMRLNCMSYMCFF